MRLVPAWLVDDGGVRVPVTAKGVILGRDASCAFVLDHPMLSRRHALVSHTSTGTGIVMLGKGHVLVNDQEIAGEVALAHGDTLALPGLRLRVHIEASAPPGLWLLEYESRRYNVGAPSFRIGGGDDDLVLPGWPPSAVVLYSIEGDLLCEVYGPINVGGRLAEEGELLQLEDRDVLSFGGVRLRVRHDTRDPGSTIRRPDQLPTEASLEFVPNGGLLRLRLTAEHSVFLADRRCDLVATLLQPPQGIAAGSFVPDDVAMQRIWGAAGGSRTQLNTLVHRVRKTLVRAGLNGATLIERAAGGRATRFTLAPWAQVRVQ